MMHNNLDSLIKCSGATGCGGDIAEFIRSSLSSCVDEFYYDNIGNTIAHKRGVGKKLMLIAHYDEVALMVTAVDGDGFLRFKPYGGVDASVLPARKVNIFHNETVIPGIIGKRPIHLQRLDCDSSKIMFEDLWIDIGAKDKNEALKLVEIGDYVFFDSPLVELPNGLIAGKALDNRIGVHALLNIAESITDCELQWDVYFVSSVQEEIGGRGAITSAHSINPDYCVVIDVTHATDYPTMNSLRDGEIKLSNGCVLAKGPNIDDGLFRMLKECAEKSGLPIQIEAIPHPTGTDANWVQISNDGVKTALISIPCRYMHTPYEIVSMSDVESVVKLLNNIIKGVSPKAISE